jgi:plasmid stabilization system protein ParE
MNQYTLIWSPKAREEYAILLSYLREWYGTEVALRFLEQTEKIAENITIFPYSYPVSDKVISLRKAVITKQSSFFYRILDKKVEIVHFWDNRQDLQ